MEEARLTAFPWPWTGPRDRDCRMTFFPREMGRRQEQTSVSFGVWACRPSIYMGRFSVGLELRNLICPPAGGGRALARPLGIRLHRLYYATARPERTIDAELKWVQSLFRRGRSEGRWRNRLVDSLGPDDRLCQGLQRSEHFRMRLLRFRVGNLGEMVLRNINSGGLEEGLESDQHSFELFFAALKLVILGVDVLQLMAGAFESGEVV